MTNKKRCISKKGDARSVAGMTRKINTLCKKLEDVFEERWDDDAYDCPGVRKGSLEPSG
jgi:hypothetical protein